MHYDGKKFYNHEPWSVKCYAGVVTFGIKLWHPWRGHFWPNRLERRIYLTDKRLDDQMMQKCQPFLLDAAGKALRKDILQTEVHITSSMW